LNFKLRVSTINTEIKTKLTFTTVFLFKLYIYTIYYKNKSCDKIKKSDGAIRRQGLTRHL